MLSLKQTRAWPVWVFNIAGFQCDSSKCDGWLVGDTITGCTWLAAVDGGRNCRVHPLCCLAVGLAGMIDSRCRLLFYTSNSLFTQLLLFLSIYLPLYLSGYLSILSIHLSARLASCRLLRLRCTFCPWMLPSVFWKTKHNPGMTHPLPHPKNTPYVVALPRH